MIQVEKVSKEYRSGRGSVRALFEVSFEVEGGTTAAIAGKSGSGKSTLLNCIGGLEQPDSGRIVCLGLEVHALSCKALSLFQRAQLGFVFQHGNLLSYLTVRENIAFPLTLNGVGGRKKAQRVGELLERIGLPSAGAALPVELSGGELQRVAFARAIAHSPGVLLADEPTASLDSATGMDLIRLMFEMGTEQGTTILLTTHDPEILKLAHRSIHLRDGCVVDNP